MQTLQKHGTIEARDLTPQEVAANVYECQNCGHAGSDVNPKPMYCGGKGDITMYLCDDVVACWQRWDDVHGQEVA